MTPDAADADPPTPAGDSTPATASVGARGPAHQDDGRSHTRLVRVLDAWAEVPVAGSAQERIGRIAARQRGRIARRQLLAAGIPSSTIGWLIDRHRLIPLHRAVYAVGHAAPVEYGRETAALLAIRPVALLSHLTAARLWGIVSHAPDEGRVDLLVAHRRSSALNQLMHVHRTRILTAADRRIRLGLPVTSPSRTLLDVAPQLSERRLELALDRCLVDQLVSTSALTELLTRAGSHPGRGPLTKLLEHHRDPAITRSEAEERVLELIRGAQLPEPAVNARLLGYEVDFLWRAQRLVLEVDGFRFHSTRRAFEHDRRKDQTLRAAGFYSIRVTWRQLQSEPLAFLARLAQAIVWANRFSR